MSETLRRRVLRLAAAMALVGLALLIWSVVRPSPLSVMVALTAGQGIGTLSFVLYLIVVGVELFRREER